MATGGISKVSVKCGPCSRKDLDLGSDVYCLQCAEYICGKCLRSHNCCGKYLRSHSIFTKMPTHTMLDRVQMEANGPQQIQPVLTVPCDVQMGQMYPLFCEKHNQVCCCVCFSKNHKYCDVRYILDAATGTLRGPELNDFRRAMKEIMNHLEKVKKQSELDMQMITDEKKTEINKIHTSIQQMIKQLKEIETTAINDVTQKFTEFKTTIENDLTKLGTMINTLNTKLDKLEKTNDNTEKFAQIKICEEDKSSARNLISNIKAREGEEKLVFPIEDYVEESIRKLRSLGQLVLSYRYAVTPEWQHRVNTKKDGYVCDITDICFADDGSLIMTDWNNNCLKRMNQNHMIIDRLKLDDSPYGVCCVSACQVAVCLSNSKTVQLVTWTPTMSVSRSFKTTDFCRGITYHADHLYVTCGGVREGDEDPGHIVVYTISGTLVRKLETDSQGMLFSSVPLGVAVRSSDDVILVCDRDLGLVALRPDRQRLWTLTLKDLEVDRVNRVCVDSHGQALVSSWRSSKVVLVSRDGRKLGVVLTARDGINKPTALIFDEHRSCLVVGMLDNYQISVFKLT